MNYLPAANASLVAALTPQSPHYPIYHTLEPSILPWITDKHLSLLIPLVAYWVFSLLFHTLDLLQLPYFEKLRIHESQEVLSRNRASVKQVIGAVVLQQVVQTLLGWVWLESEEEILRREVYRDHQAAMAQLALGLGKVAKLVLGDGAALSAVKLLGGANVTAWVYWWAIPLAQTGFAFFLIDTWQYFLHRLFHTVPFLYRHFHSVHHRLYVPYAFGALYNHPVEGLLLDSLGAVIAHSLSGMTIRQSVLLFGVSTVKTVDDHCGYRIWWDPCQFLFANNAEYHDLHHQSWGIKKNFSQPFFTRWDDILNTRMSKSQGAVMYAKRRSAFPPVEQLPIDTETLDNLTTLHGLKTLVIPPTPSGSATSSEAGDSVDSGIEVEDRNERRGLRKRF